MEWDHPPPFLSPLSLILPLAEGSSERATPASASHERTSVPSDTLPEILRHCLPLSSRASASLDVRNPYADRSSSPSSPASPAAAAAAAVPRPLAQAVANLGVIGAAAQLPQTKLGPAK